MSRSLAKLFFLVLVAAGSIHAQTPTGTIAGVVTDPTRLNDKRVFVFFLGSGLQTVPRVGYSRVTVDGASINMPAIAGVIFQVSQGVVKEFQLSTVNFDVTTSLASNGAINIVTRS